MGGRKGDGILDRKRFLTAWAVVSAIIAAVLLAGIFLGQNKTDLIVLYGIRAANIIAASMIVAPAVILAVTFLLFNRAYRKKYRPVRQPKLRPEPAPAPTPVKADINSEGYVRGKLEHFLESRPRLREELALCLAQMDSIKDKQSALSEVRLQNDAGCLEIVSDSLDKARISIWNNLLAVINIAQIWDPKEAGEAELSDVYDERRREIRARIELNDDLLKQSAILLTKGTSFANDKSLSRQADAEGDLAATIKVIDQLRDMSGIVEVE